MKGLYTGIKKHPVIGAVSTFAAFSVQWTLIEGLTYFINNLNLKGGRSLLFVVLVSLAYSAWRIRQPSEVQIPIKHTNTKIEVKFEDLFTEDGYRAIAMSEFFDSELGIPVSEKSIHGIFLKKCFGGHPQSFDALVAKQFQNVQSQLVDKKIGKNLKYPIGTTALVDVNNDHYLCFALSEADPETCKVHADVPILWRALQGLWRKSRICLGGSPIVLPLVGSGVSGVGLPPRELLDLIILSAIAETKLQQITLCIRIVLSTDRFADVDLKELRRYWS
jgi:hypothetical protein